MVKRKARCRHHCRLRREGAKANALVGACNPSSPRLHSEEMPAFVGVVNIGCPSYAIRVVRLSWMYQSGKNMARGRRHKEGASGNQCLRVVYEYCVAGVGAAGDVLLTIPSELSEASSCCQRKRRCLSRK